MCSWGLSFGVCKKTELECRFCFNRCWYSSGASILQTGLLVVKAGLLIRALWGTAHVDMFTLHRETQARSKATAGLADNMKRARTSCLVGQDLEVRPQLLLELTFGFDSSLGGYIWNSVLRALPSCLSGATPLCIATSFEPHLFRADRLPGRCVLTSVP